MLEKMKEHKKTALGVLIGGVVGSALALLFAPKSGRELRTDIKEGLDKSLDKAKESGEKLISGSKNVSGSFVNKMQSALANGLEAFKTEKDKTKARIPSIDAAVRASEGDDEPIS